MLTQVHESNAIQADVEHLSHSGGTRKRTRWNPEPIPNSTAIYIYFIPGLLQSRSLRRLAQSLADCGMYARKNNIPFSKFDIVQVDFESISSPVQARPGLDKLMQLVESGKITRIIVPSVKHFDSGPATQAGIIERLLACNVKLHSVEVNGELLHQKTHSPTGTPTYTWRATRLLADHQWNLMNETYARRRQIIQEASLYRGTKSP